MKTSIHGRALAIVAALGGLATVVGCASADVNPGEPPVGTNSTAPKDASALATRGTPALAGPVADEVAITRAARVQLASFLESIPAGDEADFGFVDRSEFSQATLGAPYEYFVLADDGGTKPANEWGVPVVVAGEMRALVRVNAEKGGYVAHALGSAKMADELAGLEAQRLAQDAAPIRARSILRSFTHVATFVAYDADLRRPDALRDVELRTLESARIAFGAKFDQLAPALRGPSLLAPIKATTVKALLAH